MGEGISSFFFHSQKIKRKCGLLFQDLPPPTPWHWGGGRGPLWFSRAILLLFLLWQTFFLKDTT